MSNKRKVILANNEIYHVFNKSIANEEIFGKKKDLERALDLLNYYRFVQSLRFSFFNRLPSEEKKDYTSKFKTFPRLVEIYAYCLMPNHFHLLLKQVSDKGVEKFLANFQNSFAKYFATKNKRLGPLFLGPFKAKHVATDEEFLHVGRYIHLNPVTSYLLNYKELQSSKLTSLSCYLNLHTQEFVQTDFLLKIAGPPKKYLKFIENQIDYQRKLNKIKHLFID